MNVTGRYPISLTFVANEPKVETASDKTKGVHRSVNFNHPMIIWFLHAPEKNPYRIANTIIPPRLPAPSMLKRTIPHAKVIGIITTTILRQSHKFAREEYFKLFIGP